MPHTCDQFGLTYLPVWKSEKCGHNGCVCRRHKSQLPWTRQRGRVRPEGLPVWASYMHRVATRLDVTSFRFTLRCPISSAAGSCDPSALAIHPQLL